MDLSVIIVNWNSKEYLCKCIASLLAQTHGLEFEIIVIDSASFDGCDRMLEEHYPHVRFLQSKENLGFGKANNAAFRLSRGRHVLFLNPDTELVGPAINILDERLRTLPRAGIVGCRLLNSDRTVQTSCIQSLPTILNQLLDSEYLRARWPRSALWGTAPLYEANHLPKVVEGITGACLMLKRDAFERVGMFSEDYFMYAEDLDLCYKLRKAGYINYYVPDATLIHYGGGSSQAAASNFSVVMMRESIWQFLRKHRGPVYSLSHRVSMLFSAIARLGFLAMLFPIRRIHRRRAAWYAAFQKWQTILLWSLNRQKIVKRYLLTA